VHLAMEHLPVASMDLLASTPLPSRLCSLELINCGLTGHHLDGLAKAARFPDLRSLSLSYNNLNSDDLSSFFASVRMDNLLTLNLGELKLTAAFLAVLSRLPFFQNLIDLNLARSCKEFPDAYPQEILTHPSLHALLPVAKDRTLEAVNPLICKH